MDTKKLTLFLLLPIGLIAGFLTGCGEKSASEKAEDAIEESAEAMEKAAENMKEALN